MSTTPTTPRNIPDEYDVLILKLTQKLKKEEKDIAAFLLVGSVAQKNYIKGDSDCDFYLVIKKNRDKETEILQRIGKIKIEFENDPQYSSLLDLIVFFEEDLTEENIIASNILNWVHIWTGQQGVLKIGQKNPFLDLKISEENLRLGASHMCFDNILLMRDGILNSPSDAKDELAFYASEAAIGCAQALLIFHGEKGFNRYNVPELFSEKIKIKADPKVVIDARDFRLGAKIDNVLDFVERCYDFCWIIYEYMLKNFKK